MATLLSRPIPNLIQGVSQQASQQRRDSQCEAQWDCVNSPKDGCVARNGFEHFVALPAGLDLTGCWTKEIYRGTERYLYILKGGQLRVLNLVDGSMGTVALTPGSTAAYLANTTGLEDSRAYRAVTVDDFTFLAKVSTIPAYKASLSASRPPEALVFCRAGQYLATYSLTIYFGSQIYKWTYVTPDNSVAGNAPYIATSQIAATFYRAMTGGPAPTTGATSGGIFQMADYPGDAGGSGSGIKSSTGAGPTATSLGFSVAIRGNILRIWRNDGQDFDIICSDAQGGTAFTAFKDRVDSVTSLPKGGFDGFQLAVKGTGQNQQSADYFVRFSSQSPSTGYWEECAAEGIQYQLDPATMPHAIVRTAPNTFEVRELVWNDRLAGDGASTAMDPGFIGRSIQDLFFHEQRLGILSTSTADWSVARNEFAFFPYTVQTFLADGPIGIRAGGSEAVPVFERAVQVAEGLHLWSQRAQFRVSQGNNQQFEADTVKAPPTSAYEFSSDANFAVVGQSLYFATEVDDYTILRNLTFGQDGRPAGDTDVTSHVQAYVAGSARQLAVSDTGQLLLVRTDDAPTVLALYDYLVQGGDTVQSAWSKWRIPCQKVLWVGVRQTTVAALVQRAEGPFLLTLNLNTSAVDDVAGAQYRTRLDLRVSEADCAEAYDATTDTSTVTLPYSLTADERGRVAIVVRSSGPKVRGRQYAVLPAQPGDAANVLRVQGDLRATQYYAGLLITSERQESTFFLRSDKGVQPVERLQVRNFKVSYDGTAYTRLQAEIGAGRTAKVKQTALGTFGSPVVVGDPPAISKGTLELTVDAGNLETTITLINDSPYPSRWQTAEYHYQETQRARVAGLGTQGAG